MQISIKHFCPVTYGIIWLTHFILQIRYPADPNANPIICRVAFGRPKEFGEAAARLKSALTDLVKEGPSIAEGV